MDWQKYYNLESETESIPEENNSTSYTEEIINNDIQNKTLNNSDTNEFINRLSGIDPISGFSKTTVSYQSYDFNAPDDDVNKQRVYQLSNAEVRISRNQRYNDLYTVDFIFKSPDDTELKLFWGRLQQYLKNQSLYSDKDWIFYINLLERSSISQQTYEQDSLLIGNIINPIIFYLTREVPNLAIHDTNINNEMIGGNIIRMLVSNGNLTFSILNDIDTSSIKGEVQREEENSRYLDNYSEE